MAHLRVDGLAKHYGSVTALAGIDLSVNEGEFITLLGPSGSGKTTLLMAIAGFVAPDAGRIVLDGADITPLEPEDRDFGFVFQGYALFPHMSVADNIAFPLSVRGWKKAAIRARVAEMLALVELQALARRRPRQLSGGQQQRVALARALAFSPKLLLLDEPLSALDRGLRAAMQRELKRLHRETGVTFLYVTHDQEEALAMSDRIAVFQSGRIVQTGTPRDLYGAPASRFVAEFLGDNNLIAAEIADGPDGLAVARIGDVLLPLPQAGAWRGRATLWVRPEDLSLDTGAGAGLAAKVVDLSFGGGFDRLSVVLDGGLELTLHLAGSRAAALQPGDPVTVTVPPAAVGVLRD